jgi:hypothetical protein
MACGMTTVKRFTYRGDSTEEFSNTYWFTGSTPADDAAWLALFTALTNQEKLILPARVSGDAVYDRPKIVRGYGYSSDADDRESVWTTDLTAGTPIAGTWDAAAANAIAQGGDTAAWIRWKTARTSRGKAIYLRKYFHPAYTSAAAGDTLLSAWRTLAQTFATKLADGSFLDARHITGRGHSDTIVNSGVAQYTTTRTLKRRAKRNPS